MAEADGAALLAAISAAAVVCGAFFAVLFPAALGDQRSAVFEALLKSRSTEAVPVTRPTRRAQATALRSIALRRRADRASRLQAQIAAAGLSWTAGQYLGLCAIVGGVVLYTGLALQSGPATALTGALIAAVLLPQRYLDYRAERRKQAFLTAFAAAVDMILRGVKSGLPLIDCLAIAAADADDPVRHEFAAILAQLKAGVPLPAAAEKLAAAMPAAEIRFFVAILSVQSQSGGNLSEPLANLSRVLRDRQRLAAKVRIASAEMRTSAMVIGALPFLVIAATAIFAPAYISMLWSNEAGRRVAAFCAVWLLLGILVLRRMARIEP
ncbi:MULTISPECIES: type II secretion system F family protein [Rhodomicrobium]|uniref:type II secretion system F family protein n=1 Tax=Rhodomicrobium TaxID=1068 RepID=UPI000B4A5C1D|nr:MULTISPECIES: type II secretion system F family protein [Rhodomicrobium]